MFGKLIDIATRSKRLKDTQRFLEQWCPNGVEVLNDGKQCWLHYGGMVYSMGYSSIPQKENFEFFDYHLECHKFCLALVGGVYSHRSLMEAWVRKYLPGASVIGASDNDIVYADETKDRPIYHGEHTRFMVTHQGEFVFSADKSTPLIWLAMDVYKKSHDVVAGTARLSACDQ